MIPSPYALGMRWLLIFVTGARLSRLRVEHAILGSLGDASSSSYERNRTGSGSWTAARRYEGLGWHQTEVRASHLWGEVTASYLGKACIFSGGTSDQPYSGMSVAKSWRW